MPKGKGYGGKMGMSRKSGMMKSGMMKGGMNKNPAMSSKKMSMSKPVMGNKSSFGANPSIGGGKMKGM